MIAAKNPSSPRSQSARRPAPLTSTSASLRPRAVLDLPATSRQEPSLFSAPSSLLYALFLSLCSLLHAPALCFQHLLSTLQKNAAGRGQCIFHHLKFNSSNLQRRLLAASCRLFALFCALVPFVFNIFYLHCKKRLPAARRGTGMSRIFRLRPRASQSSSLRAPCALFRSFTRRGGLCSLLRTRALCFQHLLSTLQKNACLPQVYLPKAGRGQCICVAGQDFYLIEYSITPAKSCISNAQGAA
jgi:hypothetical protein